MLTLKQAIDKEMREGFESADEFREVMNEIADIYDVTLDAVYKIIYNVDTYEDTLE